MNISHLLNPVGSGYDQDAFDRRPSCSHSPDNERHDQTGTRPQMYESRKHLTSDSVEQLEHLSFWDARYNSDSDSSNSNENNNHRNNNNDLASDTTFSHGYDHDNRYHSDSPYSRSDHAYNTHALRKSNQPPTPGEEPLSPVVKTSSVDDPERTMGLINDKRKYMKQSNGSYHEAAEAEVGHNTSHSNQSEGSTVRSPRQSQSPSEPSPNHGQLTPESPDQQRQESGSDTSDAIPTTIVFQRNADGKFRCTWPRCGKEFAVESRLSTHYRIHSGKPPYPCGYPGCTKAFHT
ncbi:hypothetical protein BGZ65_008987, partial [Modicella reniformis]